MARLHNAKYSGDMIKKAEEYIDGCRDDERYKKTKVNLPTLDGLARYLGVVKKTLYNWAKAHEEFEFVLEELKTEQLTRLINKGLSGQYNAAIAKLILSNNHGYREKTDLTSDNKPLPLFDYAAAAAGNNNRHTEDKESN